MASVVSSLNDEKEKRIHSFFTKPVRFHLLYKSSLHGANISTLLSKFDDGMFIIAILLQSGSVRGGYTSKTLKNATDFADADAFVFEINNDDATRFSVLDSAQAVKVSSAQAVKFRSAQAVNVDIRPSVGVPTLVSASVSFGSCLNLYSEKSRFYANFCTDETYNTGWFEEKQLCVDVVLFRVQELEDVLPSPWREVSWTETTRESLRAKFVSCNLMLELLPRVKALLLGPVGSGKSSLVNSIRSTMYRRVAHMPIVGNTDEAFTKKLMSYDIRAEKGGSPTVLSLCDVMGIQDKDVAGLTLSDALAVIQGHVHEGYKFQTGVPISEKVSGYRASPSLKEQVHCVLFVLDASKVASYSDRLRSTLRELHSTVSDLGVPQLILLTHVDRMCPEEDVNYVYSSRALQETMQNAARLVGLPLSCVLPVKNYNYQLSVDCETDILLLSVVNSILQAVDDTLEDKYPGPIMDFPITIPQPKQQWGCEYKRYSCYD